MENIRNDLSLSINSYLAEASKIEEELDSFCASVFLFEAYSSDKNMEAFLEAKKEDYTKQLQNITNVIYTKVSASMKEFSGKAKSKFNELKSKVSKIPSKSKKTVHIRPYDVLADFYASCMKELDYIVNGPTMKESFDEFVAKFNKTKAEQLEKEKKHREKCLTIAVTGGVIGPAIVKGIDAFMKSFDESLSYAEDVEEVHKKCTAKASVKTESESEAMTDDEVERAFRMVSAEMGRYSGKLMVIAEKMAAEYNKAVAEAIAEAEKEE